MNTLASGEGGKQFDFPTAFPMSTTCNTPIDVQGKKECGASIVSCRGSGTGCNEVKCSLHNRI